MLVYLILSLTTALVYLIRYDIPGLKKARKNTNIGKKDITWNPRGIRSWISYIIYLIVLIAVFTALAPFLVVILLFADKQELDDEIILKYEKRIYENT